ncbi:MAG: imidazolonepropionase-like amidohydrolase [Arenicella sp.]|jgi:imidazolonepropionase-like amidohydrolase
MKTPIYISALILFCSGPSVKAQDYLLSASSMLDTITGKLVADPQLLVKDGKIVAIGKTGDLQGAQGVQKIHLEGQTLLPGFMDMHVHLSSAGEGISFLESRLQSVPRRTVNAVANANRTLNAGFTSVRNVGAADYTVIAVRDAVNAGDVPGPRIWATGPSLGITGGHCDDNYSPPEQKVKSQGVADGPWAVKAKVRENIKYGADAIKFCATGGVFSRGTKVGAIQYSLEEMQAIVEESHRRDLVVAAHAHGTEGIKTAIIAGVDSIEHASILDDEAIRLAKKHGTVFSMDIYNTEYTLEFGKANGVPEENLKKDLEIGQIQRDSFSAAVKAGVKMVFGSDAAIYPHGDNAKQFSRMVKFGMTEAQALQAATINAARLMKSDNLGALKVGYFADIIAVPGNPLTDITVTESVSFVMKNGEVIRHDG